MKSNRPGDRQERRGEAGESRQDPAEPHPIATAALRPEHLYKAVGLLFLFLLLHSYFGEVARVLLVVFAAAIVAVAMNVLVGIFPSQRRLTSAVLGLAIFAAIGVAFWVAIPILGRQLRGLTADIPRLQQQIMDFGDWIRDRTGLNVELIGNRTSEVLQDLIAGPEVLGTAWGIIESIFLPLVILIGGLYAVAKPNARLLSPMLQVVPRDRRDDFRRLFALLGDRLKGWVKGTLIAMIAVGLLTTIGLSIIGVRYSLLLGVISGLFEIVPIVGPWVAGAVAVGVALIDDPTLAIWVALLMFGIQQLESNLITPIVMSTAAEVHPFVTLFALFLFGSLFGFLGIILAVPLVLFVWTVVEVLWVDRAIKSEGDRIEPLVRE